jgi:hypothetical protein
VLKKFLFNRRFRKAEAAFWNLKASVDRQDLPKKKRRAIFKDLLRAAGFVNIRIRERKEG